MLKKSVIVFAVFVGARVWAASPEMINRRCPVLPEELVDSEVTTTYQGKTVAFCCDRCLAKFEADPETYLGWLPQFAAVSLSDGSQHAGADGEADGHGHDHAEGASGDERIPLLGRLHPVIVHFPLAGIPLALVGFLVWVLTGRDAFAKADAPPMLLATAASVAAVITGNIAHDSMRFSDSLHEIVERHQLVATIVMVICLALTAVRIWRWNRMTGKWRWVYGGGLLVAAILLGVTGYLGGGLVFGPDHLTW